MLLEQAEGKLRAAVRPGSSNVTGSYSFVDASKGNCVFLTQECADPNYGYGRRMAVKMAEAFSPSEALRQAPTVICRRSLSALETSTARL